jgi:hypothetical protein
MFPGLVTTLAGSSSSGFSNGQGTNALFNNPYGIAIDSNLLIYIADNGNNVLRLVTTSGTAVCYSFALRCSSGPFQIHICAGYVYPLVGKGTAGEVDGVGTNVQFYSPYGIVVDSSTGIVYNSHDNNARISRTDPSGSCSGGQYYTGGACTNAPAGYYKPKTLLTDVYYACASDYYSSGGASACTACPSGSVSTIGSSSCLYPTGQPTSQPSRQPSRQPSTQPSAQPTRQPTSQPTTQPSSKPTAQPTRQPSSRPTTQPTSQPSARPTSQPTRQPSSRPSSQPTRQPSNQPTRQPTSKPSNQPTSQPSNRPTRQPTSKPSTQPTNQPSSRPSSQPSSQPTARPTRQPSTQPTRQPTSQPTMQPTRQPSSRPTSQPSAEPTQQPSVQPTMQPSIQPSRQPSSRPTSQPSAQPTRQPSSRPTVQPTIQPTRQPSSRPTSQPSMQPSSRPSAQPTRRPTTIPTMQPSSQPSGRPTRQPSTQPTRQPTSQPSRQPTTQPTCQPTTQPTRQPSGQPTRVPTTQPSSQPTPVPTVQPSGQPSSLPSAQPTQQPTRQPSARPSARPSCLPTGQPSQQPTAKPSTRPSRLPTGEPTGQPTAQPTRQPTAQPTIRPTSQPSFQPTNSPTAPPSAQPTRQPSGQPTSQPTSYPTATPYCNIALPIPLSSSRTSITLSLTLSAGGTAYCAIFARGTLPSSVDAVISAGTRIFSLTAGTVAMSIGGLIAFSNYSVYCYTVDLSERFPWPLPYVLSTGVHFSTKCCRLITLTTFPAVIYDNSSQATPPVFTFALESVPPKALIVSVQLKKSALSAVTAGTCGTSDSSASAVAIPNRFGFSTASLSLLGNFIVSGNPGCYDVSVVPTLYDYSASTQTLLVQKSTAALSAPYMTSCTFTSDGLRLTVGFSTNTDRGAKTISSYLLTFPCSQLLNFTGVAASVCYWQSASILVVSNVPSVAVGSNVTILSGRIKAYGECSACNNFPFSARRTLVAAAPADGVIPRPALSAPQKVSSCDDLYIDTTSSTGNAGRSWKRVQWGISTYPSHNSTDVLLETYLNALRGETGDVFVIPNSLIVAYDRIIFYLGLTNFLGITGWTSTSVTLVFSSEIVPRLSLIGAKHLTQYVSQPVQYFAFVQFPPCAKVDPTKIAYIWEFYSSNNTKLTAPKFYKQLNDIRYFKLDSFVLSPSTSYTLQVLIQLPSYTGSRNLSSAEAYIATLPPQGVRAIISGGNARTADVSQAVSIDGSASYDLDVGQPSGSKLFYSWTCLQILPMYGSVCPFQVPTNTNSSNFTLAAHSFVLSASTTCLITLFVKNRNSASDSAEVYIAFSTSSVPQVGFSSSALKYNPTDKITLKAILGASSVDVVVTWGCDRLDNSALQQISNAGISTQFGPTSSSIVMYLPILPGSLFAGGKYVFSVTAQYLLSSTSSTASLQVEINSPPTSGSFLVSPTLGTH